MVVVARTVTMARKTAMTIRGRRSAPSPTLTSVSQPPMVRDACQRSLSRFEAKDAAAKAAAKRDEERVAVLRKVGGEEWLPLVANGAKKVFDQLPHRCGAC